MDNRLNIEEKKFLARAAKVADQYEKGADISPLNGAFYIDFLEYSKAIDNTDVAVDKALDLLIQISC